MFKAAKKYANTIIYFFKWFFRRIDEEFILPLLRRLVKRLLKRTGPVGPPEISAAGWKQKVLEDFSWWLYELPDTRPAVESATMESCDLFTILSEFSALRQEIRFQNREQSKAFRTADDILQGMTEAMEVFKARSREIESLGESVRREEEKKISSAFFDVRDALVRGQNAAREVMKSKSFFRPLPKGADGVPEGYDMAIRRMDKALAAFEIFPVETLGRPFDPKTMEAVGKKEVAGTESGLVVEEVAGGFVRNDEILRTARVVVAE